MAEAVYAVLAITPEDVVKAGMGAISGAIGAGVMLIPKTVFDVIIRGTGGDDRPTNLVKGLIDGAFGAWCLYDVLTRGEKIEPFWRGAETAFGGIETVYGALTVAGAIMGFIFGR